VGALDTRHSALFTLGMARGLFITFEGGEGCGKSTQIARLAARLQDAGRKVLQTREPGGTEIGEQLRHLIQFSPASHAMCAETELLLFTASRAQLVRERIEPALAEGTIVLADRFLDSTTVYQGVARKLEPAQVSGINRFAVGTCVPEVTFIFDLDPEVARTRLHARAGAPDRMESQPPEFYAAVRAGYLALARSGEERFRLLDAARPIEALEAEIWEHLKARLAD
jgi:dTMP kinase